MSLTLGEKLRQAREERGITISEVADQTRISALYLASIENDDYRTLPGGIFNKGFVKSFAKYVGVDEQEALQEYAQIIASQGSPAADEPKTYRPEVLTDDRPSPARLTTIIFAGVILAAMAVGVLMLVKYLQPMATQTTANTNGGNTNSNTISNISLTNSNSATASGAPSMSDLKVEFKAVNSPISLSSIVDGKSSNALIAANQSKIFEPKQSLKLRYARAKAQNAELTINGKQIALPTAADSPTRNVIEIEINQNNLAGIWESGRLAVSGAPAPR